MKLVEFIFLMFVTFFSVVCVQTAVVCMVFMPPVTEVCRTQCTTLVFSVADRETEAPS